jgi:hypothetical protein
LAVGKEPKSFRLYKSLSWVCALAPVADPVMVPDGADLVAMMVGGLGSYGAEDGQGQDGNDQLFHRDAQNHQMLRQSLARPENL